MTIQVAVEQIDVPKKWRKVKKANVTQLADSLRREGLLHPIGVRLDDASGRYVLVYGRHRLEAARKVGWAEIGATVLPPGTSAAVYQSMTDAENLFRWPLTPAERVIALKQWHERYMQEHPGVGSLSERGRAGAEATNKKLGRKKAREQPEGDAAPPGAGADGADPVPPFVEHVCQVTGMDRKSVERYLYSGKNLAESQLEVLATRGVTHEHIKRVNKLTADQIAAVVTLVAAGVGIREAIAEAQLPPGATLELGGDPDQGRAEDDLTDEEWVLQECDEVLERLKYTVVFYADAILYRKIRDARAKFRNVAKKPLAQARMKATGPYYQLASRLVNIDHPKNWSPCGPCGGSGMSPEGSQCFTCKGHAFLITKESK